MTTTLTPDQLRALHARAESQFAAAQELAGPTRTAALYSAAEVLECLDAAREGDELANARASLMYAAWQG